MEINDYYPFRMVNNVLFVPGMTDPVNNYKYNGKEYIGNKWGQPQLISYQGLIVADPIKMNPLRLRMILANYGSGYNSTTWNDNPGYYNEALTYDVMGNILTLQRNSLGTVMDNLSYSYPSNSNKLSAVTDNSGNTAGFNDGNTAGADYAYAK